MGQFNGQLTTNEIYNSLFNMIISQKLFTIKIAKQIVDKFRTDGSMYGDTKTYYSFDVGKTYDWANDREAGRLLELNRNNSGKIQSIKLDRSRQTNITLDNYLTKRAFMQEGTFTQFNSTLASTLQNNKDLFDNGYFNCWLGTKYSTVPACNVRVDWDNTAPTDNKQMNDEALRRLKGQLIVNTITKLFIGIKDNTRDFNSYGYMRSYDPSEFSIVWNAEMLADVLEIDLPSLYNKIGMPAGDELPAKYFGTIENVTTTTAGSRALTEMEIANPSGDPFHYYGGELIGAGKTVEAGTTYVNNPNIICKILPTESVPFMSGFEVGTLFFNPRSLTENHYLTWLFNTLEQLEEKPLITLTLEPKA